MKKRILAICDLETEYAVRFAKYLDKKVLPFEIRVFSEAEGLLAFCREVKVELILVSESAYDVRLKELGDIHVIVLNESGNVVDSEYTHVDKYQSSDKILREVMLYYTRQEENLPDIHAAVRSKLIGVYSPIKRCLQTSFAITMGQIMAKSSKVLYLNFEGYSGFGKLMEREFTMELSDLMYYVKNAKGKLLYRMESMMEEIGGLCYVPPIFSIQDLVLINSREWQELLEELCNVGTYEYIILDLSDTMQGLFDVLRMCERVYTIVGKDPIAAAKMQQYEQLLAQMEYDDVLEKTQKYTFPKFSHMPVALEHLPFSELADYIRSSMRAEQYEGLY